MTRQGNYQGRPYCKDTRLGKIMWLKGYKQLYIFAGEVGISTRKLTDYLNGRCAIRNDHLMMLSQKLGVKPEYLLEIKDGGAEHVAK